MHWTLWTSLWLHVGAVGAWVLQPAQWRWALAVLVLNHAVVTLAGLLPRCALLGSNWRRLPAAAAARGEVALTIDDGPDPLVTPLVLDLLDRHAARATFFCIGAQAALHPELCCEIVRRGHTVENHSQQHRHNFSLLGPRGVQREIQAAQTTLGGLCGTPPRFFRAPAGLRNLFLQPVLQRHGLQLASWTRRGFDTRNRDAAAVARTLTRGLRAGDILLLHDRHAATTAQGVPVILEVLPLLLAAIRAAHLKPVSLRSALL
jgi:peptidoglycan/xylan/chitin deacetylase (PgdA/CDA1 family)